MSELKVNTISGIAGSVKVNDPVGIGAVAKSGYDLNVDGKVNLEGSVEVITVPASNFGVRIRAPLTATTSPGFGDSTLQFTNNQGTTEWASLHAKSDASLDIRTDGDSALTINNAQVINHLGASLFTNTATFNNAMQVNGQAIFAASVIPQCGGVPTTTTHLTNKAYVDNVSKGSAQFVSMVNGASSSVVKSLTLKAGIWGFVFTNTVQFNDGNQTSTSLQTLSSPFGTFTNSNFNSRSGGAGHGRSIEISSSTAGQFTVSSSGTYNFTLSLPSIGASRGATVLLFYLA